ncbi:MAG: sodium:solute symporter [Flavobacteriales bacterium]|nr:sodium:solute symporter [Flavobacteriales bacterium]
MSPVWILLIVLIYFGILVLISRLTSKGGNSAFYLGNKKSPWYIVAFGMIGASLSGITFISIPGWVGATEFSYIQMVLGYVLGYFFISYVLMPIYYRMNLTSIYTYLEKRFGSNSYYTGASFFLISRTIGASFRLYLVAIVFKYAIFDRMDVGWLNSLAAFSEQVGFDFVFAGTVMITILLIWLYTHRGGIGTIIWTDTLQTFFMLFSVGLTIYFISKSLDFDISGIVEAIGSSEYSRMFYFDDPSSPNFFPKKFFAGAFIAVVMTGLDQDMMQKNLSCKNLKEAQKNMNWFSIVLVFVNFVFLCLGALIFIYASKMDIVVPEKTDMLFPTVALDGNLGSLVAILFILGLIAAAYSSADSALTSLTTSFTVDILRVSEENVKTRKLVHIAFSVLLFIVIIIFERLNDDSVVSSLFKFAGYTYGPLLGLYAFGIFTKSKIHDKFVIIFALSSCLLSYLLSTQFAIGFELLIYNGGIMFIFLLISSLILKNELK